MPYLAIVVNMYAEADVFSCLFLDLYYHGSTAVEKCYGALFSVGLGKKCFGNFVRKVWFTEAFVTKDWEEKIFEGFGAKEILLKVFLIKGCKGNS